MKICEEEGFDFDKKFLERYFREDDIRIKF